MAPRAQMRFLSMLPLPLVARKGRNWARTPTPTKGQLKVLYRAIFCTGMMELLSQVLFSGWRHPAISKIHALALSMFSSCRYLAPHDIKTNQESLSWLSCNWRFLNNQCTAKHWCTATLLNVYVFQLFIGHSVTSSLRFCPRNHHSERGSHNLPYWSFFLQ